MYEIDTRLEVQMTNKTYRGISYNETVSSIKKKVLKGTYRGIAWDSKSIGSDAVKQTKNLCYRGISHIS